MSERLPPPRGLHARVLLYGLRFPGRFAFCQGAFAGLIFGTAMAAHAAGTGRASAWEAALLGLALGTGFGLLMGYSFLCQNHSGSVAGRFPAGTDPDQAVRAYELLLLGRPGEDPATNETARAQAEQTLASRSGPWLTVPLFLLFAAVSAGVAVRMHLDAAPAFSVSSFAMTCVLLVVAAAVSVPLNAGARRRSHEFMEAMEARDGQG
ncbi:hypothetical protein NE857_01765 [Nocardiopsis exhalans]|uniref:Uncharacterized protein n=1 Tax=Nocardiopsis exhalans TaxID=163604 RepID=A0ABY5D7S3_9ACTN|nr:hypothetical protein [Nocardiopsis exhalans]USY20416.1 hypothetical protein NE857_01765 [Nocardiopsis exhalans]